MSTKANDNIGDYTSSDRVILPIPSSQNVKASDMDIYVRFMRNLRNVASSRIEIKVLTSIRFVADMCDLPETLVAKVLVDMGLRAPRVALPVDFLHHADASLLCDEWIVGAANAPLRSLEDHWVQIGEFSFAAFKRFYPVVSDRQLETV